MKEKIRQMGVFSLVIILTGLVSFPGEAISQNRSLEGQTVVLYTYGGTYLEPVREVVIEPFEKETGAKVVVDDSCCQRLQAAMEAGQFIGDVILGRDQGAYLALGHEGWLVHDERLEKIARDHGSPEQFQSPSMLILHSYSYLMAAKSASIPQPKTWADFFNVKSFPGTRGLVRDTPMVTLEAALLADGVAPDELYPLDADRAFRKLNELKSSTKIIMNASGADQINNLGTGEIDYGITYSNRAFIARNDGIPISFGYNDAFIVGNGGAILKGARNVDGAVAFLEYHMRPEVLVRMAERNGMGPVYEAAAELVDPELRELMPTSAENVKVQHPIDGLYWQENREALHKRWVEWMAQ
ncbi:MAG: extracellular solute-binding protein [Mesorhizobium sp.]|nr:MAG: extracellular solute-binding protein [Mesorhizobium sp.]